MYLNSVACLIFLVCSFILRSRISSSSFKASTGQTLVIASVLVGFMFIFNIALNSGTEDVRKMKRRASFICGFALPGIVAVLSFVIHTFSLYPRHANTFDFEVRLLLFLIVACSAFWYLDLFGKMIRTHRAVRSSERGAGSGAAAAK
jgi:hypothetical protein